jgi:hypothetical protein
MSTNDSVSKSRRLKKYQKVYTEYLQQQKISQEKVPKEKVSKEKVLKEKVPKEKVPKEKVPKEKVIKDLNEYQKFFQGESKKEKYKGLDTKTRMTQISEVWKTVKKN